MRGSCRAAFLHGLADHPSGGAPSRSQGKGNEAALVHGDGRGARQPRKMVQSVTKSKQNQAILPEFRHVNDQLRTHDRARERTD